VYPRWIGIQLLTRSCPVGLSSPSSEDNEGDNYSYENASYGSGGHRDLPALGGGGDELDYRNCDPSDIQRQPEMVYGLIASRVAEVTGVDGEHDHKA
jgi:hypothetical protein